MSGKQQKNSGTKQTSKGSQQTIHAKYFADDAKTIIADAPYNFISLPTDICVPHKIWNNPRRSTAPVMIENKEGKVVVDVDATKDMRDSICELYEEYIQEHGKHSGYIELEITTMKDTLVGMPLKEKDKVIGSTFFSIKNNEPMIPGSSLRGMTRNLFKIMTASSFRTDEDFNNLVLYYRDVTGGKKYKELKDVYEENHYKADEKNIFGGFIVRIKCDTGQTIWKIFKDPTFDVNGEKKKEKEFKEKYKNDTRNIVKKGKEEKLKYPILEWSKSASHLTCKIVVDVLQNNNECKVYTFNWCCTANEDNAYIVDEQTIQGYLNDKRRKSINLLYEEDTDKEKGGAHISKELAEELNIPGAELIAPCFFIVDEQTKKVKHFGHTKFYRIPYLLSIADHVPSNLKTQNVDFTDLVFGLKEFWGGRVFFGDAIYDKEESWSPDTNKSMKTVLLGPNPTSFQMYLTQKNHTKRAHWNTKEAMIRGVKYYWQRNEMKEYSVTDSQTEDNGKVDSNVESILSNIVERNNTFRSKVYFKDLTDLELGALCKVLFTATGTSKDSNIRQKGRRFKIGKGKPMGLGTIKILSTLHLERTEAYTGDMWSEEGILNPIKMISSENHNIDEVDKYIQQFDEYSKTTMGESFSSLEESLEELYCMMSSNGINDNNSVFDSRTEYMPLEGDIVEPSRFKQRTALLDPISFKSFK